MDSHDLCRYAQTLVFQYVSVLAGIFAWGNVLHGSFAASHLGSRTFELAGDLCILDPQEAFGVDGSLHPVENIKIDQNS